MKRKLAAEDKCLALRSSGVALNVGFECLGRLKETLVGETSGFFELLARRVSPVECLTWFAARHRERIQRGVKLRTPMNEMLKMQKSGEERVGN